MNNKILDCIRSSVILQSVIIWGGLFVILFIQPLWASLEFSIIISLLTIACLMAIYYINQKIAIPHLLIKGQRFIYAILSIAVIVVLAFISAKIEIHASERLAMKSDRPLLFFVFISRFLTFYMLAFAVSSIIFFAGKTVEDIKQKDKLLSEKKLLEVRVLRSQINSHFIFNALNNIYSMTYFKDEYTSGYVLKLAQMMRYVMEDCETELTPLSKEIEYIANFIDFQKLRFEGDNSIVFVTDIGENGDVLVPPMIFQPLVENCFKHVPLNIDKNSYVFISLELKNKQIRFVSENSQPFLKNSFVTTKSTGIGIENVKRRLAFYYENNYIFDISSSVERFRVELIINV